MLVEEIAKTLLKFGLKFISLLDVKKICTDGVGLTFGVAFTFEVLPPKWDLLSR